MNGSIPCPRHWGHVVDSYVVKNRVRAKRKNSMSSNKTNAVATVDAGQATFWDASELFDRGTLGNRLTVKDGVSKKTGEMTSQTIKLLPGTSKTGDCIADQTGFKGQMLKAAVRESSDQLKTWLVQQAAKLGGDSHFTGVSLRATRSGRVCMTFKRVEGLTVERATDEELCERLGITLEQVQNIRKETQKPEEQEEPEQQELAPAPQNGKPKLVPAKPAKPASKK